MDFAALRQDYRNEPLEESTVQPDPFMQFQHWLDEAVTAGLREPNAMALATATPEGRPSVRTVLLKGLDAQGLVFYTSYESQKGQDLKANPVAQLLFYWNELERQVRIHGAVERTSREESEAYFQTRPPGARLGATASPQSFPLESRLWLESRIASLQAAYPDGNVPCPEHWGGYRLKPESFEFWQGRSNRLHDRILYIRDGADWRISRLAP